MRGSVGTQNYLKQNTVITTSDRAVLELNMNRYATLAAIPDSVYGTDPNKIAYYKAKFPLDSVTLPNRPESGICKVKFGAYPSATWQSAAYLRNVSASANYDAVNDWYTLKPRFYVAGPDDKYKYFTSSVAQPNPEITYTAGVWANKIRVTFENSLHYPTAFTIQIRATGSGIWTTIATNPTIPASGVVDVYRSGTTWSTVEPTLPVAADAMSIDGIKVSTTAMNVSDGYLAIIEMSPRLVVDVTDFLQEYSAEENFSEEDNLAPVGLISANSGSATFLNTGNDFEPRNTSGVTAKIADLVKRYTELRVTTTINAETIKMVRMLVDKWSVQEGDTAEAELYDEATPLQNTDCPEILYQNVTPFTAAVRLLDAAGFTKVRLRKLSSEKEPTLNFFFTTKDETVWEALQELFRTFQYSAFFDEDGYLNIATNEWMFGRSTPSWTFRADASGPDLPDIMEHSEESTEPANKAVVTFTPLNSSRNNDPGNSSAVRNSDSVAFVRLANRILYSPERGVLLGCTLLDQTMDSTQTYAYILNTSLNNVSWGAFAGHFIVDQEVIKFDGLEYSFNNSGVVTTVVVKNSNELSEVISRATGKVQFTGKLCNLVRGQFGTAAVAHGFSKASWSIPSAQDRYVHVVTDSTKRNRNLYIYNSVAGTSTRTTAYKDLGASTYNTFRLRMKVGKNAAARAGIIISAGKDGSNNITSGYMITLNATATTSTKELRIERIGGTGTPPIFVGDANIDYEGWETINVTTQMNSNGVDRIYLTGDTFRLTATFPSKKITYTNAIALVSIGKSKATFDWVSAGNGDINYVNSQQEAFRSVLRAGSGLLGNSSGFFESFGDTCREIFVDTIRFAKAPALNIEVLPTVNAGIGDSSPTPEVAKTSDIAWGISQESPFSARLAIANISSEPKILDELDSGLYPLVSGRVVEEFAPIEVTVKNQTAINQFGENKIEIQSKWINDRSTADKIANWVVNRAGKREQHQLQVFDNPLVEIGDIVNVVYAAKGMTAGTAYVVKSVSRSVTVDGGIDTSVTVVKV
jgi:hypothetical protein